MITGGGSGTGCFPFDGGGLALTGFTYAFVVVLGLVWMLTARGESGSILKAADSGGRACSMPPRAV